MHTIQNISGFRIVIELCNKRRVRKARTRLVDHVFYGRYEVHTDSNDYGFRNTFLDALQYKRRMTKSNRYIYIYIYIYSEHRYICNDVRMVPPDLTSKALGYLQLL